MREFTNDDGNRDYYCAVVRDNLPWRGSVQITELRLWPSTGEKFTDKVFQIPSSHLNTLLLASAIRIYKENV